MGKVYEFRDPVHGFITLNEWERDIVNQPAFQRLRRIKQLAWTDMVYPGASHSRFEHSLGVMQVATNLFESLCARQKELLEALGYENLGRQKQLVRLAALLHDIGHAPFSHAAEELLPLDSATQKHFTHEQYSAAIVEHELKDVIDSHPLNLSNHAITTQHLTEFFREEPTKGAIKLRDLVSGQLDADRMDYLLRDSLHCGVSYGKFDLNRLISTIRFVQKPDSEEGDESYKLGIDEDGMHAAEGLIIARYMMFTQVYFHKTRVIYDYHLVEALKSILKKVGGTFPAPASREGVSQYLNWDDWKVLGQLADLATDDGTALRNREHFRLVFESTEVASADEVTFIDEAVSALSAKGIRAVRRDSAKSWYKFDNPASDVLVHFSRGRTDSKVEPMSKRSPAVMGLPPVRQSRIYVGLQDRAAARELIKSLT